ncbi:MAG: hypothetical protein KDC83_00190 [Flavobacteriales bacterium]|nr:hypothetical protein [Flavobacteriales bacterium]
MIRNIDFPEVEGVFVAIVQEEPNADLWMVYLINDNGFELSNVLVNSKGYGHKVGNKVETSTLKHFFEHIGPNSVTKIEPIQKEVFVLTNQYWVSFYAGKKVYDKKYVFTAGSIDVAHVTHIPQLGQKGILHP